MENKFGIAMEDMEIAIKEAEELSNIEFIGLHFHIGSQILEMDDFAALANRVNELQDRLEQQGIKVKNINVGGGLGIAYNDPDGKPVPDFQKYFDTYAENLQLREGQQVHFELGRAVVGQMGSLITRILYVKNTHHKQFAIVDGGMSDLIRPALYDAHHKIQNISSVEPEETYDVVGPICESSDVFGKNEKLPKCHRGDMIALRSAGAYGEIMACQYNCRKLPKAYLM
jgi:diaminopimelate decarboxylase